MNYLSVSDLEVAVAGKPLLQAINLTINEGQFTALLGPNGAGKSTLLKAICGDIGVQRGELKFQQQPMARWSRIALARELGVLPQHNSLTFPFTVREVVEMGLFPLTADRIAGNQIVDNALRQVDVYHLEQRRYPTLSGGEKQRVQLARVLTQLAQAKRPLLLLDEPTSALDLAQQHRVLTLARDLCKQQQVTVLAVLHDLNQAARYADQLVVLSKGQIHRQGTPQQVLSSDTIEAVWHYRPTLIVDPNQGHPVVL